MTLEVREADEDIGIHQSATNLGLFHILAVDGDQHLIGTFQTVGDQDMATGCIGHEPIAIGTLQMVEGMLAATHIEGVAISEERSSPQLRGWKISSL